MPAWRMVGRTEQALSARVVRYPATIIVRCFS